MRLAASALALAAVVVPASSASAADTVTCDRVASTSGSDTAAGTPSAPYRTAQKLADSLTAGQTGCLRGGTYTSTWVYVLRLSKGGAAGAPIRIRSYPGERATLKGVVFVTNTANYVTFSDLDFVGTDDDSDPTTMPVSIQVTATDTTFERNDITNNHLKSCMILGSNGGWGQAVRTIVRQNVFHDCGDYAHGNKDHAIYFENIVDGEVADNLFYKNAAFAIHFYPNANSTRVHHNVMDQNGGGVVFAGHDTLASNNDRVDHNVITNSTFDYNVAVSWGRIVGTGNTADTNCLNRGYNGNLEGQVGYTASANVSADPQYVNAAAGDYRLAAGSPCLAVVGYDIAAKTLGLDPVATPAPAPTPTPTPTPAPTTEPTPAPTTEPAPVPASDPVVVSDPAPAPGPVVEPANAAPSISIVSPLTGTSFTDRLSVSVDASDDHGVTRVELWIDGVLRATDTSASWGFDWRAQRKFPTGSHTVTVKAFDAAGLSASASVTVKRVTSSGTKARTASLRRVVARCSSHRGKAARKQCVRRGRMAIARRR